jgi:hypothetical protein
VPTSCGMGAHDSYKLTVIWANHKPRFEPLNSELLEHIVKAAIAEHGYNPAAYEVTIEANGRSAGLERRLRSR